VWPVLFPMATLLFLFPRPADDGSPAPAATARPEPRWVAAIFVEVVCLAALVVWLGDFYRDMQDEGQLICSWTRHMHGIIPTGIMRALLPVSVILLAGYCALAIGYLLPPGIRFPWREISAGLWARLGLVAIAFIATRALAGAIRTMCDIHVPHITPVL